MTALRLERLAAIGDLCVLGRLTTTGGEAQRIVAKTLELPWRNNEPFKSCIPAGIYDVYPRHTQKYGKHYTFVDAQTHPRSSILIHSANRACDVEGCIAIGKSYGMLMHEPAVLHSRAALNDLLNDYPLGFTLHIEGIG